MDLIGIRLKHYGGRTKFIKFSDLFERNVWYEYRIDFLVIICTLVGLLSFCGWKIGKKIKNGRSREKIVQK